MLQDDQTYTDANLARQLEMSRAWVQKWRVRLVNAEANITEENINWTRKVVYSKGMTNGYSNDLRDKVLAYKDANHSNEKPVRCLALVAQP